LRVVHRWLPLEEVFTVHSCKVLVKTDFGPARSISGSRLWSPAIFGLMHPDRWLAGILCGLAYQWRVIRKNRLGDAMTAHAVTNFLLGLWSFGGVPELW
jgi:membrane protease YdiL (CAAX protease family)